LASAYELFDSRAVSIDASNPSTTRRWIVLGAADELEADAVLLAVAPANVLWLLLNGRSLEPQGGGVWFAAATYGVLQSAPLAGQGDPGSPPGGEGGAGGGGAPPTPSESDHLDGEFSFDTGGNTQHITQAISTEGEAFRRDVVGGVVPAFGGAIGVSKDGVAGVDVVVPKLEFSMSFTLRFVTLRYIKTLRDLTGTTNDAKCFGFERGELLFLGASGGAKGGEVGWKVNYKFLTGKNRANVVIVPDPAGGVPLLQVEAIRGHEYLWVGYADAVDENALIQQPRFAVVNKVYEEGDFARLGIGGG